MQVSLKSDKNNDYLREDLSILMILSRYIFLRTRNASGTVCTEKTQFYVK
jgi:hypothetical protein